jgi:FkbM family methyltransferase
MQIVPSSGAMGEAQSPAFSNLEPGEELGAAETQPELELQAERTRLSQAVPSAVAACREMTSAQTVGALRSERLALIQFLLKAPAPRLPSLWTSGLEATYLSLLSSGLRDLQRFDLEEALFQDLLPMLQAGGGPPSQPAALASLMLLGHNFELPLFADLEAVPAWLRPHHLGFLLEPVGAHNHSGDAERCVNYLCALTELVHDLVVRQTLPASAGFRTELLNRYRGQANFVQAYFSTRNLRTLYQQRGEIISAAVLAAGLNTLHARAPKQPLGRRIRLGIFAQHYGPSTETYFTLSHFDHIDRTCFELILYTGQASGHPLEAICRERVDRFVVLPEGLAAQAECIRDDALDILLISTNMSAVTNTATLLGAMRLAPLQVASVSTPVSTGATHVDAMLSCEWNEPQPEATEHYTEKLVRMPGSVNIYAYQYDTETPSIAATRASLGLPESAIVLFSGANFYKLIPEQTEAWIRILAAVPGSFLVLMPFNPNWDSNYRRLPFMQRLHQQLQDHGVDPQRLKTLAPVPTRADLHRVLELADLYLDPYPFSGACSLLDPIIVGVPPLVRRGAVGRSNHGASMMRLLGLTELVCDSEDDYLQAAVRLAADPSERRRIRQILLDHGTASPPTYFDTADFSARVGQALQNLQAQQLAQAAEFAAQPADLQRQNLQILADAAIEQSQALRQMTDIGLIKQLIEPFFRALPFNGPRHVVDVGACYGSMSAPLLERGWTADLLEPDPAAHAVLQREMSRWPQQARLHALAVSNSGSDTVSFQQAGTHGLSGLGESPFAATAATLSVANTTLQRFCLQQGIARLDLLKIDAEGFDFDVLQTHDFEAIQPRLVLVEYGTHFARQTQEVINSELLRMADHGYAAVIFNCTQDGDFARGQWIYRTTHIIIDAPLPALDVAAFGNIIFYRRDDAAFPGTLRALLADYAAQALR